jgi:hypothetical protein
LNRDKLLTCVVILVFYLVLVQDLVGSALFKAGMPPNLIKAFLFLKEIIIMGSGLLLVFHQRISPGRTVLTAFFLYTIFFVFVSDLPIYFTLLGFRTYVLIFFCFIVGERLGRAMDFESTFLKHLKIIFWLLLLFSILEYFFLPSSIWKNVFPVIQMKREVLGLTIDEYYNTGVQVNAIGELTRRMIGPFNDPLTLAYFSVLIVDFFIAQLLFQKGRARWNVTLGTILILLTQTRAIILGLLLSIPAILVRNWKLRKKYINAGLLVVFSMAISMIVFWAWVTMLINTLFTKGGRNIAHLDAYIQGISQIAKNPLGNGVGASSVIVSFSSLVSGTENAFINIAIEIGVVGLFWWLYMAVYLVVKFKRYLSENSAQVKGYTIVAGAFLLLIQYLFAGLVAPHILVARILIPFMIVIGAAYAIVYRPHK